MPTQTTTSATPVRRTRHNNFKENINFFEPGKQGRRTGLVLKDSGVRDEHGLEPVSGIFSSPEPSPQRNANGNDTALGSSDMVLQESSVPEVTETLNLRKTPHLPPKTATPRHTNIGGSPVRHSAVKPTPRDSSPAQPLSAQSTNRTSRRLDFQKNARPTVHASPSPFKPRFGKSRKSVFDLGQQQDLHQQDDNDDIDNSIQQVQDAVDQLFEEDVQNATPPSARSTRSTRSTASQKRKRSQPASPAIPPPASVPRSSKRQRPSLDNHQDQTTVDQTEADYTTVDQTDAADESELPEQTEYTTVDQTDAPEQTEYTTVDQTEYTTVDQTVADHTTVDQTAADMTTIDHTGVDQAMADETAMPEETIMDTTEVDQTMADVEESVVEKAAPLSTKKPRPFDVHEQHQEDEFSNHDDEPQDVSSPSSAAQDFIPPPDDNAHYDEPEHEPQPEPTKKKGRGKAPAKPRGKKKQTASAEPRPKPSRDSESVGPDGLKKPGPKSIVALRAGTPAEDEGATTTRSGRTSIKPLKYWCNETYIWNQGEVEGIVRADPVEQPKPKRAVPSRKKAARLGPIKEDEEEDEDLLPEAWEQELGVINSTVRAWDPRIGTGSTEAEGVNEDIAFASTAIKTQDVHGSSFRYAKVMTMPFFGSGMVEIPPNGFKRMKNSRKMQMVFFVHEGKVTVEIEDVQFGMTKGGVWQVPRGNNYAIMNESDRHPAKIFFAQGCETATSNGSELSQ